MSRAKGVTKTKLQERILNELNSILRTKLNNPHLQFVSFTSVDLNDDNSVCNVYWDTFDAHQRGNVKTALEASVSALRRELSKILKIRHTPEIRLFYDAQFEEENKITELLKKENFHSSEEE